MGDARWYQHVLSLHAFWTREILKGLTLWKCVFDVFVCILLYLYSYICVWVDLTWERVYMIRVLKCALRWPSAVNRMSKSSYWLTSLMIPMKMALMKFEGHNIIRKIVAKVVLFSKFLSDLVQTMYDYDMQLEKGMCSNV